MKKNQVNKKLGKADILSLLVFVGLFFVLLVYGNLCSNLDCWIQDFWQRFRIGVSKLENKNSFLKTVFPVKSYNRDIVLIIIDDRSILGVRGLFENDKSVYAHALNNLNALNPKTIGLDVFFPTSTAETAEQDAKFVEAVAGIRDKIVVKSFRNDDSGNITPPFFQLIKYVVPAPSYFRNYIDKSIRSISLISRSTGGKIYPSFQTLLWTKFKDIKLQDVTFNQGYLNLNNEKLVKLINSEYDNSLAVSGGDLLLAIAMDLITDVNKNVQKLFVRNISEICKGEIGQYFQTNLNPKIIVTDVHNLIGA